MATGPEPGDPARELPMHPLEAAGIAVALGIGVVLRFWARSDLWLDEALTVHIAGLPVSDIPDALRRDGHPPLIYVLLHGWMEVFGDSDLAVRSLSGLFAVAALPLAWLTGRRFGPRTAWTMVALLALSPFAVRYATEARMYSLMIFLVLAGHLLVTGALRRPTWPRLAGITAVSGALLLSHYWSIYLVTATAVALAWALARRDERHDRPAMAKVLAALAAGGAFLVPWLGVVLDQSARTGTPWAGPVRPTVLVADTLRDFGGGDFSEGVLLGSGLLVLFGLGLMARSIDDHHIDIDVRTRPAIRAEAVVIGATIALATLGGYVTDTTFTTRYASVLLPVVLLGAAVGVTRFQGLVARVGVLAVVLALGLVGSVHHAIAERTQAAAITEVLEAHARPGDVVLVCPDQLGPAIDRLLPNTLGLVELGYPTLSELAFVDWRDYADRNASAEPEALADEVVERADSAGSVWMVFSGDYVGFQGQCEAVRDRLAARLGAPAERISNDSDRYFEHASLLQFPGPAS